MTLGSKGRTQMKAIWDEAFLKQRKRNLREAALAGQTDADWERAVMRHERETSDTVGGFLDCPLSRCRRALRCAGNPLMCMPRCRLELQPGVAQELVEEIYAEIQQERRDAAAEHRAPCVERVIKQRVEDDKPEKGLAAMPAETELASNLRMAPAAPSRDTVPPASHPQPAVRQPPAAAPPAVAPANAEPAAPVATAAPAPEPWVPVISPETEQRINQIWTNYLAGKPLPRPAPRIRSL
jgi:hypothetical protein